MSDTLQQTGQHTAPIETIQQGWDVLVDGLGAERAVDFVRFFSKGSGDSVEERRKFWGNKTVKEIAADVRAAKARGDI